MPLNNYFVEKKKKYTESNIAISQKLGNSSLTEWGLDNIAENDSKVCGQIKSVLQKWVREYEPIVTDEKVAPTPTEEELAMIKMLREKGLI